MHGQLARILAIFDKQSSQHYDTKILHNHSLALTGAFVFSKACYRLTLTMQTLSSFTKGYFNLNRQVPIYSPNKIDYWKIDNLTVFLQTQMNRLRVKSVKFTL